MGNRAAMCARKKRRMEGGKGSADHADAAREGEAHARAGGACRGRKSARGEVRRLAKGERVGGRGTGGRRGDEARDGWRRGRGLDVFARVTSLPRFGFAIREGGSAPQTGRERGTRKEWHGPPTGMASGRASRDEACFALAELLDARLLRAAAHVLEACRFRAGAHRSLQARYGRPVEVSLSGPLA